MKKLIFFSIIILWVIPGNSQVKKPGLPAKPDIENIQPINSGSMAILKTSSRLFAEKDDLTSVILVIPSGDTVGVVAADSTYLKVFYRGNDGYIFNKHALIKSAPSTSPANVRPAISAKPSDPVQDEETARYMNLIKKYGKPLADKLDAGKIWKGMDTEMVKDSWGNPARINRVIKGSMITEEWIYRNTWLYFEDNILYQWGPVAK